MNVTTTKVSVQEVTIKLTGDEAKELRDYLDHHNSNVIEETIDWKLWRKLDEVLQ
jgi:hypothetical protein